LTLTHTPGAHVCASRQVATVLCALVVPICFFILILFFLFLSYFFFAWRQAASVLCALVVCSYLLFYFKFFKRNLASLLLCALGLCSSSSLSFTYPNSLPLSVRALSVSPHSAPSSRILCSYGFFLFVSPLGYFLFIYTICFFKRASSYLSHLCRRER